LNAEFGVDVTRWRQNSKISRGPPALPWPQSAEKPENPKLKGASRDTEQSMTEEQLKELAQTPTKDLPEKRES